MSTSIWREIDSLKSILDGVDVRERSVTNLVEAKLEQINDIEDRALAYYEIAKVLSLAGAWDGAEKLIHMIPLAQEKALALHDLALQLISIHEIQRALVFLSEAEVIAEQISESWQRAEALSYIGVSFSKALKLEEAQRVWSRAANIAHVGEDSQNVQDSIDCSKVLSEIALNFKSVGAMEKAIEVAMTIRNKHIRERTVAVLVEP